MESFVALERRDTHKYVGEYQHLDEWTQLGRVREVMRGEPTYPDGNNYEDSYKVELLVKVELHEDADASDDEVKLALADVYTSVGCGHEYDCCGCRSFWADAEHLKDDKWLVTISSSRNY